MKLHPALPSLRDGRPDAYALPPEEYGDSWSTCSTSTSPTSGGSAS